MSEVHSHRNHEIELELLEIRPGRYRWLFAIDGQHLTTSSHVLQALACAREDALMIARLKVERLAVESERRVTS